MTQSGDAAPTHHPGEEWLLEYAAGSSPEPIALLVATHLALCPRCRKQVREYEALGGALLENLEPAPLRADGLERVMERLDRPEAAPEPRRQAPGPASSLDLPQPLRDYAGGSLDALAWRRFGPVAEARLLDSFPGFKTRMLRVRAGIALPGHTHDGIELTLVLRGGFTDALGHYLRGDVSEPGSDVDHRPVADGDEECICLVVTDAPLRLTNPFGRLFNPFLRI
jgi:putative transcriptional regulator